MDYKLGLEIFYDPLKCIEMYWDQVSTQIQLQIELPETLDMSEN